MNKILIKLALCVAIVCLATAAALAQGRGKGNGNGRRFDVFADRDYRGHGRRNQNWKCGKFVNCHDARDGRWDRGDRRRNISRNNDYWEQRNRYRNNRQRLQYPYNNAVRTRSYRYDSNGNRRYIVRNRRW